MPTSLKGREAWKTHSLTGEALGKKKKREREKKKENSQRREGGSCRNIPIQSGTGDTVRTGVVWEQKGEDHRSAASLLLVWDSVQVYDGNSNPRNEAGASS